MAAAAWTVTPSASLRVMQNNAVKAERRIHRTTEGNRVMPIRENVMTFDSVQF